MTSESRQIKVLENLESAKNYRKWMINLAEKTITPVTFELGSGLGVYGDELLNRDFRSNLLELHLSEIDPLALQALHHKFDNDSRVFIHDLNTTGFPEVNPTSFISWNVFEHIENDLEILEKVNQLCVNDSRVFILVPAVQFGFSKFDLEIGHYRRYSRSELVEKAKSAGFKDITVKYVNFTGIFTWIVFVKWLGIAPKDGFLLRFYDRFLVPFLERIEKFFSPPIGQSLVLIARTNKS
jgi:hypothetical protein